MDQTQIDALAAWVAAGAGMGRALNELTTTADRDALVAAVGRLDPTPGPAPTAIPGVKLSADGSTMNINVAAMRAGQEAASAQA